MKILLTALATIAIAGSPNPVETAGNTHEEQAGAPPAHQSLPAVPHDNDFVRAAALYADYRARAAMLATTKPASPRHVRETLFDLGGHDPQQFVRGWLAFSALIAARDREFQASIVRETEIRGRDGLLTILAYNTGYACTLTGGKSAARLALNAARADSHQLLAAGADTKQQARDLQTEKWARGRLTNPGQIANTIMQMTTAAPAPGHASGPPSPILAAALEQAATQQAQNSSPLPGQGAHEHGLMADRIATLAMYHLLGQTPDTNAAMAQIMDLPAQNGCLRLASLNLQQCVAAAYRHDELPFCTGQHALADVGICIGKAVN